MSELQDPRHEEVRLFLRVLGPAMMAAGALFTVIGFGSFFAAFGSYEPPRHFWCAFVGMPLLMLGLTISKFAYFGAVVRYIAGETAPVGKDLTNYMVAGTKDSIRNVATALGEGFAAANTPHAASCPKCGTENESSANFCHACGAPIAQSKRCTKCGEANDTDARFCDHCGAAVV